MPRPTKLPTLQTNAIPPAKAQRVPGMATARTMGGKWMTIRKRVLDAAGWVCQCAECRDTGRVLPAHEVDHIRPLEDGGTDDPGNLQAINRGCHARKTAIENGKTPRK